MKKVIEKIEPPKWVLVICFIALILRIPSFFEPFSYGDEMIYLTLGDALKKGFVLYLDIHDNKPPFLYFIAALAGNVFWFKVILAFWASVTIGLFWKLVATLFPKNKRVVEVGTIVFAALTTLPTLEGNIANAENFFIGLTIAGFLVLFTQKHTLRNLILAGTLFGGAALFKIPAAFDMPAILLFWLITETKDKKSLLAVIKRFTIVTLGFLTPILLSFGWYFIRGALPEYWVAAYLQNFGYLSSWRGGASDVPFVIKNLSLLIRGALVILGTTLIWFFRKKLSQPFIFAVVWLLVSLFAVTLSERPYPHYLLQATAPIAILAGMLAAAKTVEQVLVIIPLALAAFVPFYYHYYDYSIPNYYGRFWRFATGEVDREGYFGLFDGNVARNYKIADFIVKATTPDEKIFVVGDSPPIYALSRRVPPIKYVADYHITDFSSDEEITEILENSPPELIIILPDTTVHPALLALLDSNYILVRTIADAEIWSHIERRTLK